MIAKYMTIQVNYLSNVEDLRCLLSLDAWDTQYMDIDSS